jgi:4-methyl-5(b-hydroxyethyl)-thiazole monophosphate biosynthesis
MKKVLIPLADGFEEIEAVTCIDVLRRAGLEVTTAGLPGTLIKGSRNVRITADKKLDETEPEEFDALVLVGGDPGFRNLGNSQKVLDTVKDFEAKGKLVAAICAAPTILAKAGILEERNATIYPGMERELPRPREGRVIEDRNVITSQAPGTAMEFSLKIVEALAGADKADDVKRGMVC